MYYALMSMNVWDRLNTHNLIHYVTPPVDIYISLVARKPKGTINQIKHHNSEGSD